MIYLDNASTTFPYPDVLNILSNEQYYFNASNLYNKAQDCKNKIEEVRQLCLAKIHASEGTILFTNGGCESNTTALRSIIWNHSSDIIPPHIITSSYEHHSILSCLEMYEEKGLCKVTYIKPNSNGKINPIDIKKAITKNENTILISIMHINNEVGTVNNIAEIGQIANLYNIPFMVDAVQSFTKYPIFVDTCNISYLSFSGHKFHGPKGIGGLYVRNPKTIIPLINGGNQEFGLRAGTYNVNAILGMGKAIEITPPEQNQMVKYNIFKNYLIENLIHELNINPHKIHINGLLNEQTPVLNFSINGLVGEAITLRLAEKEIYISNGSACNTGDLKPSYVLTEMGKSEKQANSAIRISFSWKNNINEINTFITEFIKIYKEYIGEDND